VSLTRLSSISPFAAGAGGPGRATLRDRPGWYWFLAAELVLVLRGCFQAIWRATLRLGRVFPILYMWRATLCRGRLPIASGRDRSASFRLIAHAGCLRVCCSGRLKWAESFILRLAGVMQSLRYDAPVAERLHLQSPKCPRWDAAVTPRRCKCFAKKDISGGTWMLVVRFGTLFLLEHLSK